MAHQILWTHEQLDFMKNCVRKVLLLLPKVNYDDGTNSRAICYHDGWSWIYFLIRKEKVKSSTFYLLLCCLKGGKKKSSFLDLLLPHCVWWSRIVILFFQLKQIMAVTAWFFFFIVHFLLWDSFSFLLRNFSWGRRSILCTCMRLPNNKVFLW